MNPRKLLALTAVSVAMGVRITPAYAQTSMMVKVDEPKESTSLLLLDHLKATFDTNFTAIGDSYEQEVKPGVEFKLRSQGLSSSEVEWDMGLYYGYKNTVTADDSVKNSTIGFNYAKILMTKFMGTKLVRWIPYLLGGIERTSLTENKAGAGSTTDFYAPTFGLGSEFPITMRLGAKLEYQQDFKKGLDRETSFTGGIYFKFLEVDK